MPVSSSQRGWVWVCAKLALSSHGTGGSLRLQPQQNASFCSSDNYLSTDPSWVFSVKLVIAVQSKDRLMYTSPWQRLGKSLREAPGCILWAIAFFLCVCACGFFPNTSPRCREHPSWCNYLPCLVLLKISTLCGVF